MYMLYGYRGPLGIQVTENFVGFLTFVWYSG